MYYVNLDDPEGSIEATISFDEDNSEFHTDAQQQHDGLGGQHRAQLTDSDDGQPWVQVLDSDDDQHSLSDPDSNDQKQDAAEQEIRIASGRVQFNNILSILF